MKKMVKMGLTYAALSIHLHCVQKEMVTRGSAVEGLSILTSRVDRGLYLV